MERREFLTAAGLVAVPIVGRAAFGVRRSDPNGSSPHAARHTQSPTLGPAVFAQRIQRAQEELKTRRLDLLVVEPSTNFQYFTGYNPGRSERLILLMVPMAGAPVVICPSFEVERLKRNSAVADVRGWEEQADPWRLVQQGGREMKPKRRNGVAAVEPSTSFES